MTSARNTSKRSGQVKFKPESISVWISPHILKLSPGVVARYAGGSQYKMDRKMETLTATLLKSTERLVNSAFVYAIYPIKGVDSERGASLQNGTFFKLPPEEQDPDIVHLVTSVCTLGPDLEVKVSQLMSQGNALQATLMDAAGVALLESLAQKAYEHLRQEAGKLGLHAGCRFGPGYGIMPLDTQHRLFELIDATVIGVQINESGVMFPMKSLSFWVRWTRSRRPNDRNRHKCLACDLKGCAFRVTPDSSAR